MTSAPPVCPPAPARTARSAPVEPVRSTRHGAGVDDVRLDERGFWGRRRLVNATATLRHCAEWMERLGWLESFDRVARGEETVDRPGWQFSDSEVYKLLEAISWQLGTESDGELEELYSALVARIAAAQDPDGYLGTAFGHPGLPGRYTDMAMGHELYNMGHLLQAGVARLRTRGPDALVDVARRAADHICGVFGADGRDEICGHPEIEVALAEFGRAVGEPRYLEQARLFVERRGRGTLPVRPLLSAEYFQDDVPVRRADALRGHAVRALYLSAGAADVAADLGDGELLAALRRQWARTVGRRTYLTGGMGSRHQDEGFGDDWELPSDRAYCETCAGVASVMLSWRLWLATGEVQYADLIERTLYNVVAASPGDDGRSFFYANPLQQREIGAAASAGVNSRAEGGVRAPWFEVSCCPTNLARTLASLPAYVAALDGDALVLLQYAAGLVRLGDFEVEVETDYPVDGVVRLRVVAAPSGHSIIRLRVPDWSSSATIREPGAAARPVRPGWVDVERGFAAGDVVELEIDVSPRFTRPDARIDAIRGTVAVERGPVVLCLESPDLPDGVALEAARIRTDRAPLDRGDGAAVLVDVVRFPDAGTSAVPFGSDASAPSGRSVETALIPYHRWAERGPSTMRVFVPAAD